MCYGVTDLLYIFKIFILFYFVKCRKRGFFIIFYFYLGSMGKFRNIRNARGIFGVFGRDFNNLPCYGSFLDIRNIFKSYKLSKDSEISA